MTKNTLLAAVATGALALTAFGAQASDIVNVSFAAVPQTDNADPYLIADVVEDSELEALTGALDFSVAYDAPLPTGNNLLVTITLTDGEFAEPVVGGDLGVATVDGDTLVGFDEVTISDQDESSVTFLVSNASAGAEGFQFDKAISFAPGATPSFTVTTTTEFGTALEGGESTFGDDELVTLVDYSPIVTVDVQPNVDEDGDTVDAVLSLSGDPVFSSFTVGGTTANLGSIEVSLNDVYIPDAETGALGNTLVADTIIDSIEVEYTGTQSDELVLTPTTISTEDLDEAQTVIATITGAEPGSQVASAYAATVTVNFNDDYEAFVAEDEELSSIVRDGVNAEVPWVASRALGLINNSRSVIRVANKGTTAANIYAEVVAQSDAQGIVASAELNEPVLVGVAQPGTDAQIRGQELEALGEYGRANILLTIEANVDDITIGHRIAYQDGRVEETAVDVDSPF
ncbi:hypothetical protein [Brevundimonas sp.]